MPQATVGQKLKNIDRASNFLRVTGEGQKVLVRFATDGYAYEGKHFKEYRDNLGEKKFEITDCPRINEGSECDKCNKFFAIIRPNKELKAKLKASTNKDERAKLQVQIDEVREQARPYLVKVSFYYPVLKRSLNYGEQPEAMIFQASMQIRQQIENIKNNGYDVTDYDFIITCTKKLPNYYLVDRIDKDRTAALSDEEKAFLEEARTFDLGTLLEGRKVHEASENTVREEVGDTSETVDSDDVPF